MAAFRSPRSGVIFPVHSLEDAHAMVELCLYPSRLCLSCPKLLFLVIYIDFNGLKKMRFLVLVSDLFFLPAIFE
jgi:hypothetical protein